MGAQQDGETSPTEREDVLVGIRVQPVRGSLAVPRHVQLQFARATVRPSGILTALVLAMGAGKAPALTLVSRGEARAILVTPDSPSEAESLAAERLQHYLGKIAGATLEVVPEAKAPDGPKVFVGNTKAGAAVRADLEAQQPPDESSVVEVTKDAVFLVGIDDPGTVHAIRRDIPWYRRHGVVGLYSETHQHWGTQHLNFIVFSRLLWDADTDVDALIDEFCTLFYGPAAEPMRAYYELLEKTAEDGPPQFHMNSDIIVAFTPEVLGQLGASIKQAQGAVEGAGALYQKRVDFAAKGFRVAWLYLSANHLKAQYGKERKPETRAEIIRRYRELQSLIQAPENAGRLVERRIAEPVVERELAAVEQGTTFPVGKFTYHDGFERGGKSSLDAVKKSDFVDGVWGLDLPAGGAGELVYEMKAEGGVFGEVSLTSLVLHALGRVEIAIADSVEGPFTEVAAADSPDTGTRAALQPPIDLTEHVRGKRSFHLRLHASNRHGKYRNCLDTFGLTGEVVTE